MWLFHARTCFLVFRPPVITGETTLNEGDTLDLDCDVSTSSPLQWFSPQGDLISSSSHLEIMNIQRDEAGIYTCIAIQIYSEATLNSTVNVIILCQCMYATSVYASDLTSLHNTGTARKCTSESTSPWVYVMVVVVVTFMILVTLLAVIIVVTCWKYSHLKASISLPKNGEYVTHQTLAYLSSCTLHISSTYIALTIFRDRNMMSVSLNHNVILKSVIHYNNLSIISSM